jgi:hypothetical protein
MYQRFAMAVQDAEVNLLPEHQGQFPAAHLAA